MIKTILCYGDSNTWGQKAFGDRYEKKLRWTTLLERKLGENYEVISAGIAGRTAATYSNSEKRHRGDDAFEYTYLMSYPYELVIIALGTNDLRQDFNASAENISASLGWYAEELERLKDFDRNKFKREPDVKLLFILPPNFNQKKITDRNEETRQFLIKDFSKYGFDFVEFNNLKMSEDGIHFSEDDHHTVSEKVFEKIKELNI